MNIVLIIGRIALVVLFILSGAGKLLDIPGTADMINSKFAMPSFLVDYANQLSQAVNMPVNNILAILIGVIEFVAALLVAVSVLARTAAVILIIYTVVGTFYGDFYSVDKITLTTHMLESLSIIGGLLIIVGLPRRAAQDEYAPPEHLAPL
jgi:putative oxidoreductase